MSRITVQPAEIGGRLPYPFHVEVDGQVGRQDYWQGAPSRVIGISQQPEAGQLDAEWCDVVNEPYLAVGAFLVLEDSDGTWSTMTNSIAQVTDHNGPQSTHYTDDGPEHGVDCMACTVGVWTGPESHARSCPSKNLPVSESMA